MFPRRASRPRLPHFDADTPDRHDSHRLAPALRGRPPPQPHFGFRGCCRAVVRRRVVIEHRQRSRRSYAQRARRIRVQRQGGYYTVTPTRPAQRRGGVGNPESGRAGFRGGGPRSGAAEGPQSRARLQPATGASNKVRRSALVPTTHLRDRVTRIAHSPTPRCLFHARRTARTKRRCSVSVRRPLGPVRAELGQSQVAFRQLRSPAVHPVEESPRRHRPPCLPQSPRLCGSPRRSCPEACANDRSSCRPGKHGRSARRAAGCQEPAGRHHKK